MSIRSRRAAIRSLSAGALLVFTASAMAEGASPDYNNRADTAPSGGAMAVDLVLARPLGFAATILGSVIFVVGLPFEALAGNISDPARRLVGDPARFTFTRPLGENIN